MQGKRKRKRGKHAPIRLLSDELGGHIGPASMDEVIAALDDHTPGHWIVEMCDPSGRQLWIKEGWTWYGDEGGALVVFGVAATEQGAGNPAVYVEAPLVLTFARGSKLQAECVRYTDGLTVLLRGGDYAMHTLTLVAWHDVLHETESGDLAPGFGPVVDVEYVDEDEGDPR